MNKEYINAIEELQDDLDNMPEAGSTFSEDKTTEELLDIYGEEGSENNYYYDRNREKIIKGKLVLSQNIPNELRYKPLLYIGNQEDYNFYVNKLGIKKFYSNGGSVACVGYNPDTKEYFGWSHRGYGKFYVGYEVKEGSMLSKQVAGGYIAKTLQHCKVLAHIFADLMD